MEYGTFLLLNTDMWKPNEIAFSIDLFNGIFINKPKFAKCIANGLNTETLWKN